jgi:hypothetical protein
MTTLVVGANSTLVQMQNDNSGGRRQLDFGADAK